jgi:hypothetical protein
METALQPKTRFEIHCAVMIAPHEEGWDSRDTAEYHLQHGHFGEPALNDGEYMPQCAWAAEAIDNLLQAAVDDAPWATIDLPKREALDLGGKIRQHSREVAAPDRAVDAHDQVA